MTRKAASHIHEKVKKTHALKKKENKLDSEFATIINLQDDGLLDIKDSPLHTVNSLVNYIIKTIRRIYNMFDRYLHANMLPIIYMYERKY